MSAPIREDLFSSDEFAVDLDVFSGPFAVLLSLITKKKLDITEIALAEVTDEFLAFIQAQDDADISQLSQFLVVAATLLDLKAARLLPHDEDEEEDLELLGARDVLFAKLLQYRAFKDVSMDIAQRLSEQSLAYARIVPMEDEFRALLPEVELPLTVVDLAILAARPFTRQPTEVMMDHLHDPLVPVDTQVAYLRQRLVRGDRVSFTELCRDARSIPTVISRFLALLELLRDREIRVEQEGPLQPLFVIRVGKDDE
ncbi:segregation and condensation protein A [Trueperella sp. LYQ143]|uniref:segregation and condensation protein A n=1 Tax=unclassified Trueperella TaxID=2630174 RepID=UPI003983AD8F